MSRDADSLREKLLRELGEREASPHLMSPSDYDYLIELPDVEFRHMGLDLAVSLSLQGLWSEARNCVRRYRTLNPANNSALIFEMRCLLEMESFTEVLALGQAPLVEKYHLISANYLMALSFEALEMYPQARSRYEAVIRQDSNFLDASLRLSRLQGISSK
jgi:hypothetical protein